MQSRGEIARGLGAKDLSILSIPQLPKEAHVQIHTIQFDGGVSVK